MFIDYTDCGDAGDTQLRHDKPVLTKLTAKEGAWPWIAEIFINDTFRCSGVLLADNWVLTVAHCFLIHGKVKSSDVVVVLGKFELSYIPVHCLYFFLKRHRLLSFKISTVGYMVGITVVFA